MTTLRVTTARSPSPEFSDVTSGTPTTETAVYGIPTSPPPGPQPTPVPRNRNKVYPSFADAVVPFLRRSSRPGEYKHGRLQKEDDIRLLILHQAEDSKSNIECSFLEVSLLENSQKYRALSYYWGVENSGSFVTVLRDRIDKRGQSRHKDKWRSAILFAKKPRFSVRDNLYAALRHFREKDRDVVLWIDALCINQENKKEKSAQVARMAEIYSSADSVCVWLGEGNVGNIGGMTFAKKVLDLVQFDQIIKDEKSALKWDALANVMKSPWFSRRWVIQEVAYAKRVTLHNGYESLHWVDFADAVTLFARNFEDIKDLFKNSREYPDPDHLVDVPALGANALINANSNLFRRSATTPRLSCLASLETLMATLSTFEASDPCDTVYALLSIAKRSPATIRLAEPPTDPRVDDANQLLLQPIKPDYTKDPRHVFIEFTKFCIYSSGSLDIICRPWAPTGRRRHSTFDTESRRAKNIVLPSWIPSLSEAPFGAPEDELNGRVNGDSFVGLPDDVLYKAAGTTLAWAKFGEEAGPHNATKDRNVVDDVPLQAERKKGPESPDLLSNRAVPRASAITSPDLPKIVVQSSTPQPSEEILSSKRRKLDHARHLDSLEPSSGLQTTPKLPSKMPSNPKRSTSYDPRHESVEGMIPEPKVEFDGTLIVKGFQIDSIKKVSPRVPQGVVLRECLEMGNWNEWDTDELSSVSEELWRTMIADRWQKGRNPPPWYRRACMHVLARSTTNGDINTGVLIAKEKSSTEVEYLRQVNRTVWNRCFLRTAKHYWYGLGPRKTRVGHIVCILLGCSVPVILREHESKECYELIGESYIHTQMDGEALGSRSNEEVERDCVIYKLR